MPKLRDKHHALQQERTSDGSRFGKRCGSQFHATDDNSADLVNILKGRKISQEVKSILVSKEYIKKWTKFICTGCISKATKRQTDTCTVKFAQEDDTESESACGDDDASQTLKSECKDVGNKLAKLVKDDISSLYRHNRERCPSISDLQDYSAKKWISKRPQELITLISSICGLEDSELSDKKEYLLAKAVEQLYFLKNSKLILPLCMRENVLLYSMTTSKAASVFKGSVSPSGSYRSLLRCLDSEAQNPIEVPGGSVRCAFDNNQIIGKTYLIKGDNKVPSSVLCSSAYIELDASSIQQEAALAPQKWMWKERDESHQRALLDSLNEHDNFFRETRNCMISNCLSEVRTELKNGTDHIDTFIEKQIASETEKVCAECGGANDRSYRICRNCGGTLVNVPEPNIDPPKTTCDPYSAFRSVKLKANKATVIPGEPDFLNPNSFDTVVKVLQTLAVRAGVKQYGGEVRHWMFVECDGLPYKLMRDLMDNVWLCKQCQKSFYGLDSFKEHMCYVINQAECVREFSWIVPVMGLLHLEMNAARSFLRLNWNVFVSKVAYVLGFKSPKAQQYCLKGSDHHKTWHLLQILYIALTKELLVPYVKTCSENGSEPTVDGYWLWNEGVINPNYAYIQQMALTFLHALMLFRTGVRNNNTEAIFAGKAKFCSLFYAQHHPKYQEIVFRDMLDKVLMPSEVLTSLQQSFTVSRTAAEGKYQGGDASLEEINKEAKSWLKHTGVPNNERWQRVFRNLQKLKKVREATMKDADVCEPSQSAGTGKSHDIKARQVEQARAVFRKCGYLATPYQKKEFVSLDAVTALNPGLVNFTVTAKRMTEEQICARLNGSTPKQTKVLVTAAEVEASERVENMTIAQIKQLIHDELEKLAPENASHLQQAYHRMIKSGSKKNYIDFYYEVLDEVQMEALSDDAFSDSESHCSEEEM